MKFCYMHTHTYIDIYIYVYMYIYIYIHIYVNIYQHVLSFHYSPNNLLAIFLTKKGMCPEMFLHWKRWDGERI